MNGDGNSTEEVTHVRRVLIEVAFTAGLVAPAGPALAFHHVFVPADECGQSPNAGGNNPAAAAALSTHNPAQDAPLPPAGTPGAGSDNAHS